MASAGAATDPRGTSTREVLRRLSLPLGVLCFLLILFVLFREILLPFIFALVIVYLMEPIVSRVGRTPQDSPTGIPRWVAVILVYLVFFGVLTTSVVLIVPRFVSEIVRFAETFPQESRSSGLSGCPELNRRLNRTVTEYVPSGAERGRVRREWGGVGQAAGYERSAARGQRPAAPGTARSGRRATSMAEAKRLVGLAHPGSRWTGSSKASRGLRSGPTGLVIRPP